MNNAKYTNPSTTLDNGSTNPSEISIIQKIIIGILLITLVFVIVAIATNIRQVLFPIAHNSIVVGGVRRAPIIGFTSVQYVISVDESTVIKSQLPRNLGDDPEWSPDEQWVASSTGSRIYVTRADGSQRMLVPSPDHGGSQPSWSPDGKQIAYSANGPEYGIYITNIECLLRGESCNPDFRRITQPTGGWQLESPDWSPDGRQIIYAEPKDVYGVHISAINVDGESPAIDLTPHSAIRQPRWSPDGSKIVGVCYSERIPNICVMNRDGSNLISLTHDTKFRDIHYPRWSPDGQKIAYLSRVSDEPFAGTCWEGCPYPNAVFIMNADGSDIARLSSEDNVVIKWFTWYP